MAKKDAYKGTDYLSGVPKREQAARKKAAAAKDAKKREAHPKLEKVKDKVKGTVNEARKVLPRKVVVEDAKEFVERQRGMGGGPKTRDHYVDAKRKAGQKVKPRVEKSKGWGKNAPIKKRKMDE
jgi:hypothetical protein